MLWDGLKDVFSPLGWEGLEGGLVQGGDFQRRFFSGVVEGVGSVLWGEQGRVNSLGWGREVDMGVPRGKRRGRRKCAGFRDVYSLGWGGGRYGGKVPEEATSRGKGGGEEVVGVSTPWGGVQMVFPQDGKEGVGGGGGESAPWRGVQRGFPSEGNEGVQRKV